MRRVSCPLERLSKSQGGLPSRDFFASCNEIQSNKQKDLAFLLWSYLIVLFTLTIFIIGVSLQWVCSLSILVPIILKTRSRIITAEDVQAHMNSTYFLSGY